MKNENGQPLNYASLFVHIEVKDFVPHKLSELAEALANPIAYQSMIEKRSKQLEALTDDEGTRERVDNEAADVEIEAETEDNLQINTNKLIFNQLTNKPVDSTKEILDKKLGDESDEIAAGNVTSLTRRMKSVRNFFAGSGSTQQQSISSGLASAANTAININTASSTTQQQSQQLFAPSGSDSQQQQQQQLPSITSSTINTTSTAATNLPNTSSVANTGNAITPSGLVTNSNIGLTPNSPADIVQSNQLQRQDTQTNLGIANNQLATKSSTTTTETTANNQLDLSDVPSALESSEIINQEPECLTKLREHKRVVKIQLEMDRELAALRKKHNKQLEKEITTMNQKRDKLMACQTKQRSLLAKTHSKLSRKSISSDK